MKQAMMKFLIFFLSSFMIAAFSACSTKDLPTEKLITIYNSNLEETAKLSPLDTMFVKLGGLKANTFHTVEVLDPDNNVITMMRVKSDANGTIAQSPLWFEVGLKKADSTHANAWIDTSAGLEVKAFNIHVVSSDGGTDFKQPFYIFYNTGDVANQPQPIVTATDAGGNIINAFVETGTRTATGAVDPLTKVYVKAERIPLSIDGVAVSTVDVYVVPFKGSTLADNEDLTSQAVVKLSGVSVGTAADGKSKYFNTSLLWDLNGAKQLINPTDSNCAYRIVVDVNKDGKYNKGFDVNNDGAVEKYIDGVKGNAVVGFIVKNTPANDTFVEIKDGTTATANKVNSLLENVAGDTRTLYFNMDNIPTGNANVRVYVIPYTGTSLTDGQALTGATYGDVRSGGFSTAAVSPVSADTTGIRFLPFIKNSALITTQTGQTYSYAAAIAADAKLSIIVDVNGSGSYDAATDYYLPAALTIKDATVTLDTYSDAAATQATRYFDETGATSGKTTVYIKFTVTGSPHNVLVFPSGTNWTTGMGLSGYVLAKNLNVSAGNIFALWNLNTEYPVKNPSTANNMYDIIVDMDDSGTFTAVDLKTSIGIHNTGVNAVPKVFYANIASGGIFSGTDYDYRDIFKADGKDTKYAPYYGVTYGIKAIWNPYISYYSAASSGTPTTPSLYQGNYVDVYIVNANTFTLAANAALSDTIDVTGKHKTLPIQYGCGNGLHQQNIWDAPMTPGSYHVIVDVNRNGKIDEGVDIIDGVTKSGITYMNDRSVVGFKVQ